MQDVVGRGVFGRHFKSAICICGYSDINQVISLLDDCFFVRIQRTLFMDCVVKETVWSV
jgi:hypothetical protein